MDKQLPVGTITFLMTDIERSTLLWDQEPDSMSSALVDHDRIVTQSIEAAGGRVLKEHGEGDSVFAVFHTAHAALVAAAAAQRALTQMQWTTSSPLKVRIAVHSSPAEFRSGDYFGVGINRCARLRQVAHGGQIVISSTSAGLARGSLPSDLRLTDLDRHRLRDLSLPERVFQLDGTDLPTGFPPLRSMDAWPNNLPTLLTSFVGREVELAALAAHLEDQRMITLVGPPGVGKTRLALQAAAAAMHDYADGVWVVELEAIRDAEALAQALAVTLGVSAGGDQLEGVIAAVRPQNILLVLDNCEDIVELVAETAYRLLSGCPKVSVLATSRKPLDLAGEQQVLLAPLVLPSDDKKSSAVEASDAVQLFAARASASSKFKLTDQNYRAVAQICRQLDGFPLAIEIAAAWTNVLGLAEIGDHLDDGLHILYWHLHGGSPRHASFETAIDLTWQRLTPDQQSVAQQLAVFDGGATLTLLNATVGRDALDDVAELIRHSLVLRADDAAGESRFRMHAVIRVYARDRLAESGDEQEVRERHAQSYLTFVESAEREIRGRDQRFWLRRVDAEWPNVRGAFRWFHQRGATEEALRLSAALWNYSFIRGTMAEVRTLIGDALELDADGIEATIVAKALHGAGTLDVFSGAPAAGAALLERALPLWEAAGNRLGMANTLNNLGASAYIALDFASSSEWYNRAMGLREQLGDQSGRMAALFNLAQIQSLQSDYRGARATLQSAMDIARMLEDERMEAELWLRLATVENDLGNPAEGMRLLGQSHDIADRLEYGIVLAAIEAERGRVALEAAECDVALQHLKRSRRLSSRIGDRWGEVSTIRYLGDAAYFKGQLDSARRYYRQCFPDRAPDANPWHIAAAHDGTGRVSLAEGKLDSARQFMELALTARRTLNCPMPLIQTIESVALLAAALGQTESAGSLLAGADELRRAVESPRPPVLQDLMLAHVEMPSQQDAVKTKAGPNALAHIDRHVQAASDFLYGL